MAISDRIVDDVNDELSDELKAKYGIDVDTEESTSTEDTTSQESEAKDTTDKPEYQVPEKFASASREEIAKAYSELEKTLGRQSQELGEHRRTIDEFIRQQFDNKSAASTEEDTQKNSLTFDDLVENPEDSVSRVVDSRVQSKLSSVEEKLDSINRDTAMNKFKEKHPDFEDVIQNQAFAEWVSSSPYRIRQAQAADKWDFEAADELISAYKEITSFRTAEAEASVERKAKQELKEVASESGSTGESPRKVYRRNDLIRLRMEDPDRFDAMQDEIMLAYQEGRVKR